MRDALRTSSWWWCGCVSVVFACAACDSDSDRHAHHSDAGESDASHAADASPHDAPLEPGVHVAESQAIFQTAPFTIPAGEEKFLCFATTLDEDLVIDGYVHAAQRFVHHVVFSRAMAPEPDGLSECDTLFRFTWDPLFITGAGASEFLFPDGVGHRLEAGTQLVVQLHLLNADDESVTDSVAIEMRKAKSNDPKPLAPFVFGSSEVSLPAQETTTLQMMCELPEDVQLVAAFPHMHLLGRSMKFEVSHGDEPMRTVFERTPFDFDDQHADLLDLRLSKGDKTRVSCTYENTRDATVTFGESTNNEMCFFIGFAVGREGLSGCSIARRRNGQ